MRSHRQSTRPLTYKTLQAQQGVNPMMRCEYLRRHSQARCRVHCARLRDQRVAHAVCVLVPDRRKCGNLCQVNKAPLCLLGTAAHKRLIQLQRRASRKLAWQGLFSCSNHWTVLPPARVVSNVLAVCEVPPLLPRRFSCMCHQLSLCHSIASSITGNDAHSLCYVDALSVRSPLSARTTKRSPRRST
jgi:hypothetical protein